MSSRVALTLTCLPLGLASFAFLLQLFGGDSAYPQIVDGLYSNEGPALPGWGGNGEHGREALESGRPCVDRREKALSPGFPHQKGWHLDASPADAPKICITTTTAAGLQQVLPWLFYHKSLGVSTFLLFVEGKAASPNSTSVLEAIPGVRIIFRTKLLDERQARSRIWNETWLSSFFYRPCNYELFVRQSLNMEMAIRMARAEGAQWIAHIDTDELLYPGGGAEYSLQRLLKDVPEDVDSVVFPNYETAIERDDITDPFTEVTMFKKNFDHVAKEVYFGHYREASRGNPNYFLTYGNGKSAARMTDYLRPNGAHRWNNYAKTPKEQQLAEAAVLHYTYAKFSDLTSRRDRCGCLPNKDDVKRCFMLEFDREAFIIASTLTEEGMLKWYREHVVWTDPEVNQKLLKKGLFGRIYTPQVVVRGVLASGLIEEAMARGAEMRKAAKAARLAVDQILTPGGGSGSKGSALKRTRMAEFLNRQRDSLAAGSTDKEQSESSRGSGLKRMSARANETDAVARGGTETGTKLETGTGAMAGSKSGSRSDDGDVIAHDGVVTAQGLQDSAERDREPGKVRSDILQLLGGVKGESSVAREGRRRLLSFQDVAMPPMAAPGLEDALNWMD